MNVKQFIQDLTDRTEEHKATAEAFLHVPIERLNAKPTAEKWSVLECIEHLNKYGRFYNPEIKQRMENARHPGTTEYKPGVLGNFFAKSMLPRDNMKKMKTFKSMNPSGSSLTQDVLHEFINQQEELIKLLSQAAHVDLTKTKTSITISNWIKLRLGDTFRFYIFHIERHIRQAQEVLQHVE